MNETVECWLVFAREDLQVAEILLEKAIYNQSCFHAQQCVEKALKGLLIHHLQRMPPKIHVTADLLALLPPEWFADVKAELLEKMDDYYITTRYPDVLPGTLAESLPGDVEAEEAIALACIVLETARELTLNSK